MTSLLQEPRPATTGTVSGARFGVNLAGAEFAGHNLPGVYGVDYIYPSAEILDYYQSKGRTLIRLPFHWERMQRELFAELDAVELGRLKDVLHAAHERGLDVIVDLHNYGRYHFSDGRGFQAIIGSEYVPYEAFGDVWSKLAAVLGDEPAVYAYGLMNEPHDMEDDARWPLAAQAAIEAIREVDNETIIMVSGDAWSSSRSWRTGPNETLNEKVHDPQGNLIFESHCYFDRDNSGQYLFSYEKEGGSTEGGVGYVRPFVEWCKAKGVRGFIGEYGVPDNDPRWLETMSRFMDYLQENNISSTYWAGGPWWGDYPLSIEPADARNLVNKADVQDRPQMLVMEQYEG